MTFATIDHAFIGFARRYGISFGFFALFLVYAWFGALKVLDLSPASPLVLALLAKTMPGFPPATFMPLFGLFEVLIGVMFLFPKAVRVTIALMAIHMGMVFLPLILLPNMTWTGPFVPTLEGQYIIKNVVLLALALTIVAGTKPVDAKK
jgi:uncharacterized membrane protein YkgB